MLKKIIDYALSFLIVVLLGYITYMFAVIASKPSDDCIHMSGSKVETLLNDNYVFVNLGPAGLPDDQGYMVDYIENDTIYLIPNTEEAGY